MAKRGAGRRRRSKAIRTSCSSPLRARPSTRSSMRLGSSLGTSHVAWLPSSGRCSWWPAILRRSRTPAGRRIRRGVLAHRINPSRRSSPRSAEAPGWARGSGWGRRVRRRGGGGSGRGSGSGGGRWRRRGRGLRGRGAGRGCRLLVLTLRSRSAGIADEVLRLATDTEAAGSATARGGAACGSGSRPARPAANSAPNDARASTSTSVSWRMPVISWGTWWPSPGPDRGTAPCGPASSSSQGKGRVLADAIGLRYRDHDACARAQPALEPAEAEEPALGARAGCLSARAALALAPHLDGGAAGAADAEKVDAHLPDAGEAHHTDHGPG